MIFFLDIDGVMVHANPHQKVELEKDGFYKFNPQAIQILNAVIYKTKDKVILSTSHRFKYSISEWKIIFKTRGLAIRNLSILDDKEYFSNHRHSRKEEILGFIKSNHLDRKEVVIIDDDKSLNDLPTYLKDRLVLTNSYTGLNDLNDLRRILQRRLSSRKELNYQTHC
ncbi:HAD domain-containing protein [Sphingobacterium sp. KU25419]|nr:HAD domain-containing protein [Sphingobacterium sp. KU25419]